MQSCLETQQEKLIHILKPNDADHMYEAKV